MKTLFDQTEINGLMLKNRFVRSATWEGLATEKGETTPELIGLMKNLARGNVGLIITGHAYVQETGQASFRQMGVYADVLFHGLKDMADEVHQAGGKIVLQLAHAGLFARTELTRGPALGPSIPEASLKITGREMSVKEIREVTRAFIKGAILAKNAGFDGVQIHAAHGYLLSQFLSPIFNRRSDEYGGSIQNRARMLLDVLRGIRDGVGTGFPVLVKLNSGDYAENGLTPEDAVTTGALLAENNIDAIEISGGLLTARKYGPSRMGIRSEEKEAYFQEAARAFRRKVDVPLMLVGGIRSYDVADRLVQGDTADYISMCRPFIREPDLIQRWQSSDTRKAECISDNRCFKPALDGQGILCNFKN